ncbi:hypothetical protein JQC91_10955 [Jannaschia sp. Os4]|uniref:hypothetical protein n=1 Tax=Jannaschia sp. Os4 TaxID=2807617 RepID=UPI00193993BE|nr:hypothetical protein [Jannaschia sp. Os4]MBM2576822.1 hypothetical protein [Jannaschia sp. Os4]
METKMETAAPEDRVAEMGAFDAHNGAPQEVTTLDMAKAAFGGTCAALHDAVARLRERMEGPDAASLKQEVKEIAADMAAASKTLSTVIDQEARARDEWKQRTGGGGIDLSAARDEVRRKIARLEVGGGA